MTTLLVTTLEQCVSLYTYVYDGGLENTEIESSFVLLSSRHEAIQSKQTRFQPFNGTNKIVGLRYKELHSRLSGHWSQ